MEFVLGEVEGALTALKIKGDRVMASVPPSTDRLDNQVRCLWELDSMGIKNTQIKSLTVRGKEIMAEYSKPAKLKTIVELYFCLGKLQPQHG
ncbi:hypothetical protein TNIN_291001 [Trichonephila inaurata madagascariensis]|uniref:Uncharacterized protein n=1 Tax=Trichonephila inaurata madagascariensis TaxID=2747483 RepID=A0A8X7C287_9ARAC|nr:hypothetical protein TNIN_291001 [Trichonephila inaurata madagascariensis]